MSGLVAELCALCRWQSLCRPVQISEQPVAFLWKDFVSQAEARHLAELAAPRLKRSGVGGGHDAGQVLGPFMS